MAKSRKQSVVDILNREVAKLEQEESMMKMQWMALQKEIRDIKQAVLALEGSTVHIPLSTRVIDTIQQMDKFVSAAQIAERLMTTEEFVDLKALKRDVNSVLNRMRKKNAVFMLESHNIQVYGLLDWLNEKQEPLPRYKVA